MVRMQSTQGVEMESSQGALQESMTQKVSANGSPSETFIVEGLVDVTLLCG